MYLKVAVVIAVKGGECRFRCKVRGTSSLEDVWIALGPLIANFRAKMLMLHSN